MTIEPPAALNGSAMHFILSIAARRAGRPLPGHAHAGGAEAAADDPALARLWELAERHHPEQVWLAQSWLRGERTLADLERTAPRSQLSPGFFHAAGPLLQAESVRAIAPTPPRRSGHAAEPAHPNDAAALVRT